MKIEQIKKTLIGKHLVDDCVFGEIFAIREEEDCFIVSVHNRNARSMMEQHAQITLTPKEIEYLAICGYYEWTHLEPGYEENETRWRMNTMTEVLDRTIRIIDYGNK